MAAANTRPQLLSPEVESVIVKRTESYGDPYEGFTQLARIWTALIESHYKMTLPHPLPPRMSSLMLVALKTLRATSTPHPDSHVDLAAFNQFAADFAHREQPEIDPDIGISCLHNKYFAGTNAKVSTSDI